MNDDEIRLTVPVGPDDHVRGPDDAPVTLVEYGDYECPFCAQAAPVVAELLTRYAGRLRFAFRHFPLRMHEHAEGAAEAAEFAAAHGRFWEMHDRLYAHPDRLAPADLAREVAALGLDPGALAAALRDGEYAPLVDEMKEGGEEAGIPGTPAFFLNGAFFEDEPDALGDAIAWLLERGDEPD